MRCEHEHDDGAYVLGALSPAERAAYERHLATCSFCREAVADMAMLPGLLDRIDATDFEKLVDPTPATFAPFSSRGVPHRLPPAMPRRKRKNTLVRVLSTAAAALLVAVVVGVGTVFVVNGSPDLHQSEASAQVPGPMADMVTLDPSLPISAQIRLTAANGGTKVDLLCVYAKSSESPKSYTLRLVAYGPDDQNEQLGSWVASPGREFPMSAATHLAGGGLTRLSLVRNDGKALLSYDVP